MCLRDHYSGKSNGVDETIGEDLGYQKPTYSSIIMENLYLKTVQDLSLEFSFVGYNLMGYDDRDVIDEYWRE